jgi:hypothetical protein
MQSRARGITERAMLRPQWETGLEEVERKPCLDSEDLLFEGLGM